MSKTPLAFAALAAKLSEEAYPIALRYVQSGAHLVETPMGHYLNFDTDGNFQVYSTSKLLDIFGAVELNETTTASPETFRAAIEASLNDPEDYHGQII
jgi:hypothetical protein